MYQVEYVRSDKDGRVLDLVDPSGIVLASTESALPTMANGLLGLPLDHEAWPTERELLRLAEILNSVRTLGCES